MAITIKSTFTNEEIATLALLPNDDLQTIRMQCRRAVYIATTTGRTTVVYFEVDPVNGTTASIKYIEDATTVNITYHAPQSLQEAISRTV